MHWKFPMNFMGGAQENQVQSNSQDISTQSWYPPSVGSSSSLPPTPTSSSGVNSHQRASDSPSHGQASPGEAAEIISRLKDKSVDDLRKLLTDKEAYNTFLHSLDLVKSQNSVQDELRRETLRLARENLEKEPRILELRNQSVIIRTSELAAAQEKLAELERQKEELLRSYSSSSLLQKMHDGAVSVDEESKVLHRQLLEKEIDLPAFVQKYKKLRNCYHRRELLRHAAATNPGF